MAGVIDKVIDNLQFFLTPNKTKYELWGKIYNNINTLITMCYNSKKVKCNLCGWEGNRFYAMVIKGYIRENAVCRMCGSSERHRVLGLFLLREGCLSSGMNILDIAPIRSFESLVKNYGCNYTSIDIDENKAMIKMDITKMDFPDGIFDLIICSHVLEHVKDDIKALNELCRVLRPDGRCIIIVPFNFHREETIEYDGPDPLMENHVRDYGRDVFERIRLSGFKLEEKIIRYSQQDEKRYGLFPGGEASFFLCTK